MQCVLAANDDAAVRNCYMKGYEQYLERSKEVEAKLQLSAIGKRGRLHFVTTNRGEEPGRHRRHHAAPSRSSSASPARRRGRSRSGKRSSFESMAHTTSSTRTRAMASRSLRPRLVTSVAKARR